MTIKELYKISKQLRHNDGCIIITRLQKGVTKASLYGSYTADDLDRYTKGFNNGEG